MYSGDISSVKFSFKVKDFIHNILDFKTGGLKNLKEIFSGLYTILQ